MTAPNLQIRKYFPVIRDQIIAMLKQMPERSCLSLLQLFDGPVVVCSELFVQGRTLIVCVKLPDSVRSLFRGLACSQIAIPKSGDRDPESSVGLRVV